ncbi:MAG: hypothetical protein H6611_09905 [Ignavibacteriales bacterium]|nr:hypothetical protein [Ignavibacteriales bacterium]
MNSSFEKIQTSFSLLDNWLTKNGWTGYDPYDIKDVPFIIKITDLGNKYFIAEIFREILFEFFLMFPNFSRKIFKIKPQVNSKGMGLFAASYIDLYKNYNEEKYLAKAYECFTWLDNSFKTDYGGKGWGYPFSWQSKKYIPKNTPNGIVSTAVGDAYWKMFKLTNNQKYLNSCTNICEFLTNLPIDIIDENQICFSYTPLYTNHVHNLNLFVAEFLIRIGKEIDNQNWIDLGIKAANYTVTNQMKNGAFDYNGPPEKPQNIIDHYHTCFVIRNLYSIWKLTNDVKYFNSLSLCYDHYVNNFFIDATIPKYTPTRRYRIDIHSCAEAINCLAEISDIFPEGRKIALNVANWTIDNLQSKKGFFYHGIFKSRIWQTPFISKIAYIRWGQAWMLKGLSNLLRIQKDYKEIEN